MAVIAAISVITACSNLVPLSRVAAAEARWQARGIQSYDYSLEILALAPFTECSPGRRIDVEVRNGRTQKFGSCSPDSELARSYGSMPQIFASIRKSRSEHPPRYLAQFNSSLGYPEHIDANYSRTATDHNIDYYVRDFRRIP